MSSPYKLLIQSFGRENEYRRAVLAILSYFAYTSQPDTKVILFTDNPAWFHPYLKPYPVHYELLTAERIKAFRGEIDFLHRMKIAEIEVGFDVAGGNLLYADSDTFFTADPSPYMYRLSERLSFMHLREYMFKDLWNIPMPAATTFHEFVALIENQAFTLDNESEFRINPHEYSWNAGVIMLHASHKRFLKDVYALTDQFYPPTRNHASEQYAFSVILNRNTELHPCEAVIYHYWYRTKKQVIDDFLTKQLLSLQGKSTADQLSTVRDWVLNMEHVFKHHVFTLKDNSIQSFCDNKFANGYQWVAKAIFKGAWRDKIFLKDVMYHIKRHLLQIK
jgi:hypothetical protein